MEGWKFTKANGTDHYSGKVNYRKYIGKELIHPCPNTSSKNACGEGFHLGKTLRGAGEYGVPDAIFRCSYTRKDVLGEDKHKVRVSRLKVLSEEPVWKGYGPWGKQYLSFLDSLKDIKWFENVGKPYKKPEWAKKIKMVDSRNAVRNAARYAARYAAWNPTLYTTQDAARDAAGDAAGAAAGDATRAAAQAAAWAAAGDAARAAAGDAAGAAAWAAAGDATRAAAGDATRAAARDAAEIIGGVKDGYFSRLIEVYRAGHYPISFDGKTLVVY